MKIRKACEGDVAAIAALSRELALHVEDPDPGYDTQKLLSAGFGKVRWFDCLVAEVDAEVVGFALYCKRFEAHTRSRTLWLGDLVVAEGHRARGIGRGLVNALRIEAAELVCDGIVLDLWTGNLSARSFYRKMGAKPSAEVETHVIPTAAE